MIFSACVYLETTDNDDTDYQKHINVSFLHVYKQEIEEEEQEVDDIWYSYTLQENYARSLHNRDDTENIILGSLDFPFDRDYNGNLRKSEY